MSATKSVWFLEISYLGQAFFKPWEFRLYTAKGIEDLILSPPIRVQISTKTLKNLLSALRRLCVRAMDPGSIPTAESRLLAQKRTEKQLYDAAGALEEATSMLQANGSSGHAIACILARL